MSRSEPGHTSCCPQPFLTTASCSAAPPEVTFVAPHGLGTKASAMPAGGCPQGDMPTHTLHAPTFTPQKKACKARRGYVILEEPKKKGEIHSDISSQPHSPDTPLFCNRDRRPHAKQVQFLQGCKPQPLAALGCSAQGCNYICATSRERDGGEQLQALTTDTHERKHQALPRPSMA